MSLESSRCIQCAPAYCGEREECWRYGLTEGASSEDLCIYSSYDACMEVNGPGSSYVDPDRCLVYFNDNGWTPYSTTGVDLAFGMYGATNQTNPIPTNLNHTTPNSNAELAPDGSLLQSRLWAYDILDNSIYYVDSLTHEGSDVAMGITNLWVGCEYNIQPALPGVSYSETYFGSDDHGTGEGESSLDDSTADAQGKIANLTINEYKYEINGNDPSTFTKTPTKVYRFVNESGTLLSIQGNIDNPVNTSPYSSFATRGASLGNSIASIDDNQIIFDSETANYDDVINGVTEPGTFNGNIWYANLTDFYSGETISSTSEGELIEKTWVTNNSVDESGNKYFDTREHTYNNNRRSPSDGWYRCAAINVNTDEGTVDTLPIYTIVAKPIIELDSSFTQGDIEYISSDPVYGNEPSVVVTYWNASTLPAGNDNYDLGCPQNPGNGLTQNNKLPCSKNIARWKFPSDLENITVQLFKDRCTSDSGTTETQSNTPTNSKAIVTDTINNTLYTTSGAYRWGLDTSSLLASNPVNMNFKLYNAAGNGQLYTWNDYQDIGNQEKFTFRGGAQIPSCLNITAYTYTCSINGCYATLGTGGTYTTLSACSASCLSYSCKTECGCPTGYTWNPSNNLCEATTTANQNSPIIADKAGPTSWGHNGTWMCVDRACNDYYGATGPSQPLNINPQSGFWGSQGDWHQARLNSVGVWPGNSGPNPPPPSALNYTLANPQWHGITRCIDVSATSVYLVGIGAESHFRLTINDVIELDTTTALNNFDPNDIGGFHSIMNPGAESHGKWWIQRFELPLGQNVITVEGAYVQTWGGTYQAGFGTEVIGPFDLTAFTSTTSYSALTIDVYTANTVFSTADIVDIEVSNNCNLSLPIVPYSIFGTLPAYYLDPHGHHYCLTSPGSAAPPNQVGMQVPFKNAKTILNYPWFADSSVTFTDLSLGYNNTPARNLLFKDFITLVETDWSAWPSIMNTSCTQFTNASATGNCITSQGQIKFTNEFFRLGGFKKTGPNSSAVQTYQVWQPGGTYSSYQNFDGLSPKFYRWVDFIDWLNQNGLTQSGVPVPPANTVYPAVDYNATYFDVMYAVWNYWSLPTPHPNPSVNELEIEVNNSYSSPNTWATFLPNNGQEGNNMSFCECTIQNGYLDTQIFECPVGYVYNGCNGLCVATTACTTNQSTSFAGGCYELVGTGITNTYTSQTECQLSCDTVSALTYYSCTTTGVTVVTGTTTPYTSSAAAESACYSYNCTSTGCTQQLGSGGTYASSSLCYANCQSYNCSNWGCQQQAGSGGTYSSLSTCSGICSSFECLSNGCQEYDGTGYTYSALSQCSASCLSYECTTNCCSVYNTPVYGTGGTYVSLSACTGSCVSWACNKQTTSTGTTLYAYYDTSGMHTTQIRDRVIAINDFAASSPNGIGNVYHTFVNDERWLGWGTSVYRGSFSAGVSTALQNVVGGQIQKMAVNLNWAGSYYDNCAVGNPYPLIFDNSGNQILTKGPAPTASTSSDVLVVCFISQSSGVNGLQQQNLYTGQFIAPGTPLIPEYSGGTNATLYQPTSAWKTDYAQFITEWSIISGTSANSTFVLYPQGLTEIPTHDYQKVFALHAQASISSGNKPALDGTWAIGTAPRTIASGGVLNGTPGLCNIADLTSLELPQNPYVLENVGKLDQNGWVAELSYPGDIVTTPNEPAIHYFSASTLLTYLNNTLLLTTTATTGCISACTTPTQFYPYTSITECTASTTSECNTYMCTDTGCIVATGTSIGLYTTLADCTGGTAALPACTSYNCGDTGCTEQTGSGGTYSTSKLCLATCTSWSCPTYQVDLPYQVGCYNTLGTGGTYTTYSACTGGCRSWECLSPCSGGTTGSCIEYPHTGGTYSSATLCSGSCEASWWCVPETTIDTCSGKTHVTFIEGIPNSPLIALEYLANPLNGLQTTQFGTFMFDSSGFVNPLTIQNAPCDGNTTGTHLQWLAYMSYTAPPNAPFPGNHIFHTWADVIAFQQSEGYGVTLNSSLTEVRDNWTSLNSQGQQTVWGPALAFDWCECASLPCSIECIGGSSTVIPPTWTGPYASSGSAFNECCANTWDCIPEQDLNSCSGKTQIPGVYTGVTSALNWVSTNMPNVDVSTLMFESSTQTTSPSTQCSGTNGGILKTFDGIAYSLLNNGQMYGNWNLFVSALIGTGLNTASSGMSLTQINYLLNTNSGSSLSVCESLCYCEHIDCYCVEVVGSGGSYSTQSQCQSGCCPTIPSATSWNCESSGSYRPICQTKTDIGVYSTPMDVMEHFRTNQPNNTFGLNRFVYLNEDTSPPTICNGAIGDQTTLLNMFNQTPYSWNDCYVNILNALPSWLVDGDLFVPYNYITKISHPLISGSSYNTWNSFYNDVVAAGVTGVAGASVSAVCSAITYQLNPLGNQQSFGCVIEKELCCNPKPCYCYEIYGSGGTYTTEPNCIANCCPCEDPNWINLPWGGTSPAQPNYDYHKHNYCDRCNISSTGTFLVSFGNNGLWFYDPINGVDYCECCTPEPEGYTCNTPLGVCVPALQANTPPAQFFTTLAACTASLTNPTGPCYSVTSWDCIPSSTIDTCDNSLGYINQVSPGTVGNQNGTPFITSPTAYPFTSSTLTATSTTVYPQQVESILTNNTYWDPSVNFSATTWEWIPTTTYQLPNNICIGPNGYPVYRLISIAHPTVNNGTYYYNWETFVTAATSSGYLITTSINILENLEFAPNWNIQIEPCICTTSSSGCTCVEIMGSAGAYSTQALCDKYCCEPAVTYNCTSVGCVDPLDGSGYFTGITALQNCIGDCWEYVCDTNGTVFDDCVVNTPISSFVGTAYNTVNDVPGQSILSTSIADAVNYIADPTNGLQNTLISSVKFVTDIAYWPLPNFVPTATVKVTNGNGSGCFSDWLTSGWAGQSGTINQLNSCTTTMPFAPNATTNPATLPVGSAVSYNHWASISHLYIPILINLHNLGTTPNGVNYGIDLQTQITSSQTWAGFINMLNDWNTTVTGVPSTPFDMAMTLVQADAVVNSIFNGFPNWIIENNPCGAGYTSTKFGFTPGCIVTTYKDCCCSGTTCDCIPNVGTGNTSWSNSQYIPCFSGCCGGNVCNECDIYLVTNSNPCEVSTYDPVTNTTNYFFTSPTIGSSPDIANYGNKIWLYNETTIEEWIIDFSNCSVNLNRTIILPQYIGAGLDAINDTTLIGGSTIGREIIQIDITATVPVLTPIVTLPWNEEVAGDIIVNPATNTFIVAINRSGIAATDSILKTYNMGGTVLETYNIPTSISSPFPSNPASPVWGMYCFSGKTYLITSDKREYEILYNPLEVAPISTQTVSISDNYIHGASTSNKCCSVRYEAPDTFDCVVSPTTNNSNCQLNLVGNGLYPTLASCQSACTSCVTWNCVQGTEINTCSATTTMNQPESLVSMLVMVAQSSNGLQGTLFNTLSWPDLNFPVPVPSGNACISNIGGIQNVLMTFKGGISHISLNNGTLYYTWTSFVTAAITAGIPVNLNMTFLQVTNTIKIFYKNIDVILPSTKPCECYSIPCDCVEVYDGSGQYTSHADCIGDPACCGPVEIGYDCDSTSPIGCVMCYGPGCTYTDSTAISAGYLNALAHCQAMCITPPNPTWDCGGCGPSGPAPCVLNTNGTGTYLTLVDCMANPCPCYWDCIPTLGDCMNVSFPTPYLTYLDCVTDPTTACNSTNTGCTKCCATTNEPPQAVQLVTTTTPCVCPPSHPIEVDCNHHGGPCVQNVSCATGYVWSWIYCQCVCSPESCIPGYTWNSLLCSCEPIITTQQTSFEGTQAEVAVRLAEFTGESLKSVTAKIVTSVAELEDQIRRGREIDPLTGKLVVRCGDCNSTTSQVGTCLSNGCLEFKVYEEQDDSDVLLWKTLESGTKQSYDCYNGTCIVVSGKDGKYSTLEECLSLCGGITASGDKPSNVGPKMDTPTLSNAEGAMVFIETGDGPGVGKWHGSTNHPPVPPEKEPSFHRCCPTLHNGTYPSVNPCFQWDQWGGQGGVNLYTGAQVLGTGCGPAPGAPAGTSDPEWCCEWAIIVGSDRALKENIVKVGKSPSGINIYEFDYKDKSRGVGRFSGVIGNEVPQASIRKDDGYLYVDYSKIDVEFKKVR